MQIYILMGFINSTTTTIDGFQMQTAVVALRSGNSLEPQEKRAADKNGEKWPQKPAP